MFVKITEGSGGAWWKDHVGEIFEVKLPGINDQMFKDTHYMLVNKIPGKPVAVAISKNNCIVVDNEPHTNKSASYLLSKEE